jgi:hypothetical protein
MSPWSGAFRDFVETVRAGNIEQHSGDSWPTSGAYDAFSYRIPPLASDAFALDEGQIDRMPSCHSCRYDQDNAQGKSGDHHTLASTSLDCILDAHLGSALTNNVDC